MLNFLLKNQRRSWQLQLCFGGSTTSKDTCTLPEHACISQEEINSIQNVIISESSEEKLMILAEDASYGLKIRLKW